MRSDRLLEELGRSVVEHNFPEIDMTKLSRIHFVFGRKARTRLGSIRYDQKSKTSTIRLSGYLKDQRVPEIVLRSVIVHELIHYIQGFGSPLPKTQKHPHAGGVIKKELVKRGLYEEYKSQRKWLKNNWPKIINVNKKRTIFA